MSTPVGSGPQNQVGGVVEEVEDEESAPDGVVVRRDSRKV